MNPASSQFPYHRHKISLSLCLSRLECLIILFIGLSLLSMYQFPNTVDLSSVVVVNPFLLFQYLASIIVLVIITLNLNYFNCYFLVSNPLTPKGPPSTNLDLLKDVKAMYTVGLREGCLLPEFFPVS